MMLSRIFSILFVSLFGFFAQAQDLTKEQLAVEELEESLKFNGAPSVDRSRFSVPRYSDAERRRILANYGHLDPRSLVNTTILEQAVLYFEHNKEHIRNKNYITIIDFSKHSGQRRFFVINVTTGEVEAVHTAHGVNSDPDDDGHATVYSNRVNSLMSSIGFAIVAETYHGKYGYSVRLDGLQDSNSRVRERAVVIHRSDYVNPNRSLMGMSWGCPALAKPVTDAIVNKIHGGSLLYMWYNL